MIVELLTLAACLAMSDVPAENRGVIAGVVVNASQGKTPVGGSKVVLRVRLENQFTPFGETTADEQGRFCFENLPVGKYYEYLPGANRDGVHYPGPQVQITPERPRAAVELSVCDSISAPSPLVLRRQEILLRSEPGVLYVTESLVVDNPSSVCYVGQVPQVGAEPITLLLNIPPEFERATFDEEYFGRHFAVAQGRLFTSLPWPPGKKEVKFTYTIRNAQTSRIWERPLDLPCSDVCVRVQAAKPDEIACNLASAAVDQGKNSEKGEVVFQSAGSMLPAGYVIEVDMAHLPVPWMAYARWAALAVLIGMVGGASVFAIRRRGPPSHPDPAHTHNPGPIPKSRRSRHTPEHGSRRTPGDTRNSRISP
jgi:hypothetical protein